jgi:hypothetical protein
VWRCGGVSHLFDPQLRKRSSGVCGRLAMIRHFHILIHTTTTTNQPTNQPSPPSPPQHSERGPSGIGRPTGSECSGPGLDGVGSPLICSTGRVGEASKLSAVLLRLRWPFHKWHRVGGLLNQASEARGFISGRGSNSRPQVTPIPDWAMLPTEGHPLAKCLPPTPSKTRPLTSDSPVSARRVELGWAGSANRFAATRHSPKCPQSIQGIKVSALNGVTMGGFGSHCFGYVCCWLYV